MRRSTGRWMSWPSSSSASRQALAIAAALALSSPAAVLAVPPEIPASELGVTRWGDPDGLSVPQVSAVAIARDGFLWAGTRDGLARFDGRAFREDAVPGVPPATPLWINDVVVDGRGVVWAAMMKRAGLVARRGIWQAEPATDVMGETRALLAVGEDVYAAGERGVFLVRSGTGGAAARVQQLVDAAALGGPALSLATGASGAIWIGAATGVWSWDGARLQPHPSLARDTVRSLTWTRAGEIWIGTLSGLTRAKGAEVQRSTPGLPAGRIYAVHEDRHGSLWVGNRVGLYRWNGVAFEQVVGDTGVSGPVWDLAEDGDGNLWAATSGGLVRVRAPLFRRVPLGDGPQAVTAFHLDADGGVWAGVVGRGLGHRRGQQWRWWTIADGLCTSAITALWRTRAGVLWIGGEPGGTSTLCRFDGGRFVVPPGAPPPDDPIRAALEDSAGRVWIGGRHLYTAVADTVRLEPALGAVEVERIRELDGTVWLATRNGLRRRQGDAWVAPPGPTPLYEWFYDVAPDGAGGLLLGGESGFARLLPAGRLTAFTRRHGFANAEVFGVHRAAGTLWLATRNGPVTVREEHVRAFERGATPHIPYRRHGRGDGLPADLVVTAGTSVMAPDGAGNLWFATAGGLVMVDPRRTDHAERPPAAVIDRVMVNGEPLDAGGALKRPRHRGAVQVEFTAAALADPEALRFRYRLDPFDRDWVDAGARRTANYTNLPPGRYRLLVSAALASTTFGADVASLSIELEPRLHETAAFRVALALAALAAALAFHRWRTGRVRALHRVKLAERTRIARELHDTLAQSVNAIAYRLEEARMNETELVGETRQLVDAAWQLSLDTVKEAREAIWQLRSDTTDTDELGAALRRVAAASAAGIAVDVQVAPARAPVPAAATHALVRIAQEAITNAARYARATRIEVRLTDGDALELRVSDDGAGMTGPAGSPPGHFGIVGMRERAAEIGGTLRIESAPGRGTSVIATIPRGRPA